MNSDIIDVIMKKQENYQDYTLTIPADILMIVDRAKLVWDDFDFTIWIKDGTPHFCDMVGYWDDGNYNDRTPEQTWTLVRKWWEKNKNEIHFDEDVVLAKEKLEKAQSELDALEKKAKNKGWHFWK